MTMRGWQNLPFIGTTPTLLPLSGTAPSGSQSVREMIWIYDFYKALLERAWCVGRLRWPSHSWPWNPNASGEIISSASISGLSVPGANWIGDGGIPWVGTIGGEDEPYMPDDYDVIIDRDITDPSKLVHLEIVDHTSNTLTVRGMEDYITSQEISSPSDLVGYNVYIIGRKGFPQSSVSNHVGRTGIWHLERWPSYPNIEEIDFGIQTSYTSGVLTDNTKNWPSGLFAASGLQLTTRDNRGYLRRVDILDNTNNQIFIDHSPDWYPEDRYAVIRPSGIYRLSKEKHQPFAYYRGAMDAWYYHKPENGGTFGHMYLPSATVSWLSGSTGEDCEPVEVPANDNGEVHSEVEEMCDPADTFYAPHFYKSWRGLQSYIETAAFDFVAKQDYIATSGIPRMVPSLLFKAANINAMSGTIAGFVPSGPSAGLILSQQLNLPWHPMTVYYAIGDYNSEGDIKSGLYGTCTASGNRLFIQNLPSGFHTRQVDISLGWSRFAPLEFKRMFPAQCFIPDIDPSEMGGGDAVDPPEIVDWEEFGDTGVGSWTHYNPSYTYVPEIDRPSSGVYGFRPREKARFVGDNWTNTIEGGNGSVSEQTDPQLPYYDHFYVGKHLNPVEVAINNLQIFGTASSGSKYRLIDSSKDWYTSNWYQPNPSVIHIESGVATGGGTTSIEDSSKDITEQVGAFWNPDRFIGFAGPYRNFVIEIHEMSGIWHKRPITGSSADDGGMEVSWTEPLPFNAGDKEYRIREPAYEINRWQERPVWLFNSSYPSGVRRVIKQSDDNTLYWSSPLDIDVTPGTLYAITNPRPGTVWEFSDSPPTFTGPSGTYIQIGASGYWVAPNGNDTVRTGVTVPSGFHPTMNENLPTVLKLYGRFTKGDYTDYPEFYNQIYRAINSMVWTKRPLTWTSRRNPGSGEMNVNFNEGQDVGANLQDYKDSTDAEWGNLLGGFHFQSESDGAAPEASAATAVLLDDSQAIKSRAYAYPKVQGIPTIIYSDVDAYTYCAIDSVDSEPDLVMESVSGTYRGFQSFGDPVSWRTWTVYGTAGFGGPSNTPDRIGEKIGSDTLPDSWPPDPPEPFEPTGGGASSEGYYVLARMAIVKWDVPSGLVYVYPTT